jgi:hypothetical protein
MMYRDSLACITVRALCPIPVIGTKYRAIMYEIQQKTGIEYPTCIGCNWDADTKILSGRARAIEPLFFDTDSCIQPYTLFSSAWSVVTSSSTWRCLPPVNMVSGELLAWWGCRDAVVMAPSSFGHHGRRSIHVLFDPIPQAPFSLMEVHPLLLVDKFVDSSGWGLLWFIAGFPPLTNSVYKTFVFNCPVGFSNKMTFGIEIDHWKWRWFA